MKKILLIDVDSKIPNIALMKLSAYYKSKTYEVDFKAFNYSYYPHNKSSFIDAGDYEMVFVSIIFKNNINRIKILNCDKIFYGGVGYSLEISLCEEIEGSQLDYSLYPENDISYGFITRGCIRNCSFCVVPKKEGLIHRVNDIDKIIKHKKVKFLDNNILSYKHHIEVLKELRDKKIKCQFNQGLDIRLITHENALLLSQLNYLGEYIFAFDNVEEKNIIESKLYILKQYIKKDWKIKMYIYCHPDMNIKDDLLFRINWCKDNKVLPYLMRHTSCWKSENSNFYIDLCAYCNQVSLFKKLSFQQFMEKRTNNLDRREKSIKQWEQSK